MDIQFYGGNCLTIGNKQVRIVVDDTLPALGQKSVMKDGDIVLYTGVHEELPVQPRLLIDGPGEYEIGGVSVYGIAARGHMEETSKKDVTMYKVIVDDLRFLITGHIYPELSETQLEDIGAVDVMFVPVGGNGYTTDPVGALKLIKAIEPKLVVPTHYDDSKLKFEVPAQPLDAALSGLGIEVRETTDKLKLKAGDVGELLQVIVLKRAS